MQQTADLELSIHRQDGPSYAVDVRYTDSDPENQTDLRLNARQQVLTSFDFPALHELMLAGEFLQYGKALSAAFFADEALRTFFAQVRAAAEQAQAALRIRLAIGPSAQELYGLRWETLLDPHTGQPLAMDHSVYFSRYLSSQDWRPIRLRARGELRMLAAIAAPAGLEKYNLANVEREKELATIQQGAGEMNLLTLEHATLNGIIATLTDTPADILYIVAHGTLTESNEPILWLEDEQGQIQHINGGELTARLHALENRPRLVVLASCQSAGKGSGDVLSALGPRLAEAGIPAVLAMQGNVRMETVAKFMPVFFQQLQKDGRIDRALNVARSQISDLSDWCMPVLFMRLKSGRLWYTPGESLDGHAYDQWPALMRVIQKGRCTPVLGPGLSEPIIGSLRDIARRWAEKFKYPLAPHERESFTQVAQFLSVSQPAQGFVFDELEETLRDYLRSTHQRTLPAELREGQATLDQRVNAIGAAQRQQNPLEAHRVLARLPLSVYITANADELLEEALRAEKREPQSVICPWNEEIDTSPITAVDAAHPLVFHFFGRWSQPESLVLTEDDYFRFLIGVTGNKDIIPPEVRKALSQAGMLFMGFQADEWPFRALFHTILSQPGGDLRAKHAQVAAQLEPEDDRLLEPQRARQYLEKYLYDTKNEHIEIYWGSPQEFAAALWQKWQAGS